jgi:PIN domain nuclease of toxin-antitoxin system
MKLLLDTCTFLWLIWSPGQLSADARDAIVDPANEAWLSAASGWEIVLKWGQRRLSLASPPWQFVPAQRRAHGIESLAIDEEAALRVARLPALHRDPFDRVLVSQAVVHGLTLVTPDPLIEQYAVRTLW